MKRIKKFAGHMKNMCPASNLILRICLVVSCLLLTGSLLIFVYINSELTPHTYKLYLLAREMLSLPCAILLIGTIGSVCAQDLYTRK